jgi:5,10-methylenetetrahydromethanopterin reductase
MKLSLQMHSLRGAAAWIGLAQKAEACGFAEVHIAERLDFGYATWPTLFLMAEHTRRILLGPGVTNPYSRHPVVTAKQLAMLDAHSGGRAVLGLGQGDLWQLKQLGLGHPRPLAALREAVQVVRYCLAGRDDGYCGEVFSIAAGARLKWQAVRPEVAIFVGSRSPGGMAVAGEVADELHLPNCVAPEFLALARNQIRLGAERAVRPALVLPLASSPQCSVSRDREAAARHARARIGAFIQWLKVPCELLGISAGEVQALAQAAQRSDHDYLLRYVPERYLRAFAVAGTPTEVIAQLEALAALGLDHITLNEPGPDLEDALDLLGKEVLPHFR